MRRNRGEAADDQHRAGKDCAEALLRVLALGVPPAEFAAGVSAVVNQRLVRKLCETARRPTRPRRRCCSSWAFPKAASRRSTAPASPTRTNARGLQDLRRHRLQGRTAIFELLVVGDGLRKVLAKGADVDTMRRPPAKDGMHSLQEEGVLLVAKGVTSLARIDASIETAMNPRCRREFGIQRVANLRGERNTRRRTCS